MPALELPTAVGRRAALAAAAGCGAAAFTAWAVWRSSVLAFPHSTGVLRGLIVLMLCGAGAFTWWQRPASRFGPAILGLGGVYALSSLMGFSERPVYTLGRVSLAAFVLCLVYVALSFPYGRLHGDAQRRVFSICLVAGAAMWIALLALATRLPGGYSLTDCVDRCPGNPFTLVHDHGLTTALIDASRVLLALIGAAATFALAARVRSAPTLPRRGYVVVLWALVAIFAASVLYSTWDPAPGTEAARAMQVVVATASFAIPVGLVVGQLRAHVVTAWSLQRLVGQRELGVAGLEQGLREAMGDETLALFLWIPVEGAYVDSSGRPATLPTGDRVVVREVRDGDLLLGAVAHSSLIDDAAGVAEALAAASLVFYNRRQVIGALAESRRATESAEHERVQLERDLHDGVAQRLLTLQMGLARAAQRARPPEVADELHRLGAEASLIADDLRQLAHGVYPSLLLERGLAEALQEATRSSGVRIEGDVGRLPPHIESAAYFCILEAVQNALKHGGDHVQVAVSLERRPHVLAFEVLDDGVGFDPAAESHGVGLASMRERLAAVTGTLAVTSGADGTRVTGRIAL